MDQKGQYVQIWPNLDHLPGPITHFFDEATLKTNPTHLLNFLPSSTKKKFMTKFGQIVSKYYPNLAKFGHTGLSGP